MSNLSSLVPEFIMTLKIFHTFYHKVGSFGIKRNDKIFTGTACIIMAAPTHYDSRQPIDTRLSNIDKKAKRFQHAIINN